MLKQHTNRKLVTTYGMKLVAKRNKKRILAQASSHIGSFSEKRHFAMSSMFSLMVSSPLNPS